MRIVAKLHAEGIGHGDLGVRNVVVTSSYRPRLTDWTDLKKFDSTTPKEAYSFASELSQAFFRVAGSQYSHGFTFQEEDEFKKQLVDTYVRAFSRYSTPLKN